MRDYHLVEAWQGKIFYLSIEENLNLGKGNSGIYLNSQIHEYYIAI